MEVMLGDRPVGDGQPCYVLAEIGINHNGDTQVAQKLIDVAARGYAVACEEFEIGLNSVAVPVRDHLGTVVASISVSGPAFRFTGRHMAEIVEDLKEAGERVSRRMGYAPLDASE